MNIEADFTTCAQCGARLDETMNLRSEARRPCRRCGCLTRHFNLHVSDYGTLYEMVVVKEKQPGRKKPIREFTAGDDLHRDSGQWNQLTREIDRSNDRYREMIVNPRTGEVIREVDEPLSQHVNRGSAKKKLLGESDGV